MSLARGLYLPHILAVHLRVLLLLRTIIVMLLNLNIVSRAEEGISLIVVVHHHFFILDLVCWGTADL